MNRENETTKGIPYGISDYSLIRSKNYYYVDKTRYLEQLMKVGRYLFFIRPRRFGKSLFITMMKVYYDVEYRERFEEHFKGTWIYDHPTDERGKYLMLSFNFSVVDPAPDRMEDSFLDHIKGTVLDFIDKYRDQLDSGQDFILKTIKESRSPLDILSNLLRFTKRTGQQVYLVIDEYDNFANTILATSGKEAYHELTRGTGLLRAFFNVIKSGTTDAEAPVTRTFITGVSPITMDDVTSGYNIGKNVSMRPALNRMLGFTREDVTDMIDYYNARGMIRDSKEDLMMIFDRWYGNYLFSQHDDVRLFNTDMILYFMDNYLMEQRLPEDLIDSNVKVDYAKLRHLIIADKKNKSGSPVTNGNFSKLKEIIETGGTTSKIAKDFPLEKLTDSVNFKSLLFFLGLLTIKEPERNKLRLEIPNETIRRLYYDYIEEAYRETNVFAIDLSKYQDLMTDMAYDGHWKPLFDFITGHMSDSMGLRDLITGEKSIQAFLNVYLGLSDLYIIHSEKELNNGYADIFMEPFLARYDGIEYSYLLELKYIKTGAKREDTAVKKLKKDARDQLKCYSLDKKFKKSFGKTALIKIALIFSGNEVVSFDEVKQ